jgi:mannosyltransferase
VAVGTALRAWQITLRSLWFDEAFSWRLIQFSWPEMFTRAAADVHPPLYYIVVRVWSVVFSDSLLALRSFSVVAAAATIAAAYLFGAYAFRSRWTGLLAAALVAFSPWQIQFAWEARMYTLGTALVLLTTWLLVHAVRDEKQPLWWLAYAFAAAAFAYIHYYALFSLIAQALFVLLVILVRTRGRLGEMLHWRLPWLALGAAAGIVVLYVPWLPVFLRQNSQVQASYWIPPLGGWSVPDTFFRMFRPTAVFLDHSGVLNVVLFALPIILVGLGAAVLLWHGHRHFEKHDAIWLTVFAALVPFAVSIIISLISQSLYQDRFFVFAHPFILTGLAALLMTLPWRAWRIGLATAATVGFLVAFGVYWRELNIKERPGVRGAVEHITAQQIADEPILVSSPFIYFSVQYYAGEQGAASRALLISESGELAHFAGGPILRADDITTPTVFADETLASLWVVDTTGFGGQPYAVPAPWQATGETLRFPEVFSHQGDILVTRYTRTPLIREPASTFFRD